MSDQELVTKLRRYSEAMQTFRELAFGTPIGSASSEFHNLLAEALNRLETPSTFERIEEGRFAWSLKTFPDATPESSLAHAKDEMREIKDSLSFGSPDIVEYVDAVMLLMDSLQRAGFTLLDFTNAYVLKAFENTTRTWVKLENGSYKHVE